ncbi:hypothetical protein GLW08_19165 [Pontibacillus yanchengensis]|uniref:Uncharacterized protein n=2 Tax=Pontibacillus yanchengensis TaxID=462910 RepID=A0ACC7VJ21_9BACI|nr:hypothetical protein [Pontibacillus yanchengensis]MYL33665.1 hypothetical protein [Pontibacillus yanchengensis]MYL55438.1 hypothetical protein [Pontibacillus yanchengensis]
MKEMINKEDIDNWRRLMQLGAKDEGLKRINELMKCNNSRYYAQIIGVKN